MKYFITDNDYSVIRRGYVIEKSGINSSPPSSAYMRHRIVSALV